MDLYPTRAEFSVDGRLLHTFAEGLPGDSMRLMVNAWYPDWLPGKESREDGATPTWTGSGGRRSASEVGSLHGGSTPSVSRPQTVKSAGFGPGDPGYFCTQLPLSFLS